MKQTPPQPAASNDKRRPRRNRVRTKNCAKCFTPCTTINRCIISPGKGSTYLCDICWPTYCEHNPDYRYEGTWQNGRIIDSPHAQPQPQITAPYAQPESSAATSAAVESNPSPAIEPTEDSQNRKPARETAFRKRGRRLLGKLVRREGGGNSARRE